MCFLYFLRTSGNVSVLVVQEERSGGHHNTKESPAWDHEYPINGNMASRYIDMLLWTKVLDRWKDRRMDPPNEGHLLL